MIRELFTEKLFGGLALGDRPVAEVCQFTLFLGQPVYTFAVVLASLLVFSGIGANLSGRLGAEPQRGLQRVLPILLFVLLITAF
jgi:hypothetical protein